MDEDNSFSSDDDNEDQLLDPALLQVPTEITSMQLEAREKMRLDCFDNSAALVESDATSYMQESLILMGSKGIDDIEEMIQNTEDVGEDEDGDGDGDDLAVTDQEHGSKRTKTSRKRNRRDRDGSTASSSSSSSKRVCLRQSICGKFIDSHHDGMNFEIIYRAELLFCSLPAIAYASSIIIDVASFAETIVIFQNAVCFATAPLVSSPLL